MGPMQVWDRLFLVGGSEITDSRDCSIYLLDFEELVLIDAGAGPSAPEIARNVQLLGLDPTKISTLILTHCHIDHIGGAHFFRQKYGSRIVMHELDAGAVERGDRTMTAAFWYNLPFPPLSIDLKLAGDQQSLDFGENRLTCVHTPGHTPGSLSVYVDLPEGRALFGQDIHGPFYAEFGSNMDQWRMSMEKLLSLEADMLCEGHFGIFAPKDDVRKYIIHYLESNDEEL